MSNVQTHTQAGYLHKLHMHKTTSNDLDMDSAIEQEKLVGGLVD